TPSAGYAEIFQRQTDWIDDAVALVARGVGAMRFHSGPHRGRFFPRLQRQVGFDIGWRRRRWRAQQFFQYPIATQYNRRAVTVGRTQHHRALAKQAEAALIVERYAAELCAVYLINAVMSGQALIQKCVIGGQQLGYRTPFEQYAGQKTARLFR